ncbi:MAG: ribosomal protein [Candidatus Doudnabacteria bacterium]|nr:ribosomal protein [Candidatus Doudnabacteria bacterium]
MATKDIQDNKEEKAKTVPSKENTGDAYRILVKPLVTEKGYRQMTLGQYAFKVNTSANKISVAKAVEKVYDVKVVRVNIMNIKGKTKNFGKAKGRTSDWRKAIVTLKKGQTIAGAQA